MATDRTRNRRHSVDGSVRIFPSVQLPVFDQVLLPPEARLCRHCDDGGRLSHTTLLLRFYLQPGNLLPVVLSRYCLDLCYHCPGLCNHSGFCKNSLGESSSLVVGYFINYSRLCPPVLASRAWIHADEFRSLVLDYRNTLLCSRSDYFRDEDARVLHKGNVWYMGLQPPNIPCFRSLGCHNSLFLLGLILPRRIVTHM